MLRKWRLLADYTQAGLAERLGVSQSTVANWESGQAKPDLLLASELAAVLNVPVVDLIEYFKKATGARA